MIVKVEVDEQEIIQAVRGFVQARMGQAWNAQRTFLHVNTESGEVTATVDVLPHISE